MFSTVNITILTSDVSSYTYTPALGFVQLSPGVLTLSLPESIMETLIKGGSNLSLCMKSYAVTIQVKPLNPILPGEGGGHIGPR